MMARVIQGDVGISSAVIEQVGSSSGEIHAKMKSTQSGSQQLNQTHSGFWQTVDASNDTRGQKTSSSFWQSESPLGLLDWPMVIAGFLPLLVSWLDGESVERA